MKEISTIIPVEYKHIGKINKDILDKIDPLLRSREFEDQVMKIRDKFNLPAYGIKRFLGTTDNASRSDREENRKKVLNLSSLMYDNATLKTLKIKVKSKKAQYQREINKLRHKFGLPIRFQDMLAVSYMPYNKIPKIYTHSARCLIRIAENEHGENRIFIEIFRDTKKQDLIKAWKIGRIERLKKQYKLKGAHLFRYTNYYDDKSLHEGKDIASIDYPEKYIRKKRFRDFIKKT